VQITEGHRLFGRASLTKVTIPTATPETGKVGFSVELDRDANMTYSSNGTELRCRFWIQGSLTDYRRFFVTTAPVFEIRSTEPRTPGEWMNGHVRPLRELVTLAIFEPQTVAWATLDDEHEGVSTDGSTRSFQLFSGDIQQAPYAPTADPHQESRTLFTFPDLPYGPVELLRRWEDLRTAHRGLIQPLMQGLTEQMNPRARFLFLVQALEGLHTETVGERPCTRRPAQGEAERGAAGREGRRSRQEVGGPLARPSRRFSLEEQPDSVV
jgi:ApeA N-terminal domain 1